MIKCVVVGKSGRKGQHIPLRYSENISNSELPEMFLVSTGKPLDYIMDCETADETRREMEALHPQNKYRTYALKPII